MALIHNKAEIARHGGGGEGGIRLPDIISTSVLESEDILMTWFGFWLHPLQFPSPGLHTGQGERIQAYQASQHNFKLLDVTLRLMLTSPVLDDKIKIIYTI